jgi:DNA-binding transcriptional regulator YdaS (Cro superfamily)
MDALKKAIDAAGGVTALASRLGVRQSVVSNWLIRGQVPSERCREVELAVGGKVTRYELRPDVFGPEPTAEAA